MTPSCDSDGLRASAVLHVLTGPPDPLASGQIRLSGAGPGGAARVIDLSKSTPDYQALLDAIFEAETVVIW